MSKCYGFEVAMLNKIGKVISNRLFIRKHEHEFEEVKYLYLDKHSDTMLIVFSAFTGENRKYNYFSRFRDINISQLYILDTWGVLGSYYWYENGLSYPEQKVSDLIKNIKEEYNIKRIITAGTSKGGSAAIYFGIKHKAASIYSGACQYRVGTYLNRPEHIDILTGMMGSMEKADAIHILDKKIEDIVRNNRGSFGTINLFYSTKELTYERQISPLIKALDEIDVHCIKTVNDFPKHDDVGIFFPEYLITNLEDIL